MLGVPLLKPTDVQCGRSEVDLIPSQVCQLGSPQAVPVSHEGHGGVPVAVAVYLSHFDETW